MRIPELRFTIMFLVLILAACKESPTEPAISPNLIVNGNFETDHAPTLEGWHLGSSQLAKLVDEVPQGGGGWALELTADWAPTMGFAYTPITSVESGDIVQLSAFVRAIGPEGGGSIQLRTGETIWTSAQSNARTSDTSWTQLTLVDTLALGPNDTLWVVLSSFETELIPRKGLFDLITLKRINSR